VSEAIAMAADDAFDSSNEWDCYGRLTVINAAN